MDSICRFMPPKKTVTNLKTVHFVYETDFVSMKQPFIRPIYYLHLVTSGEATIRFSEKAQKLTPGTIFFFFPAIPYEIDDNEDFRYAYISFMGDGVLDLLSDIGITMENSVFKGFSHLIELWLSSIIRISQLNANLLTESVLLNTLSCIAENETAFRPIKNSKQLFDVIVDYVDTHYREPDVSLRAVANIFSYTEKYLSHFFKSNMGIGFNEYVNKLRLQRALDLIEKGADSVTEVALNCGFSDPLYFSKFFKKKTGLSPSKYIQKK